MGSPIFSPFRPSSFSLFSHYQSFAPLFLLDGENGGRSDRRAFPHFPLLPLNPRENGSALLSPWIMEKVAFAALSAEERTATVTAAPSSGRPGTARSVPKSLPRGRMGTVRNGSLT